MLNPARIACALLLTTTLVSPLSCIAATIAATDPAPRITVSGTGETSAPAARGSFSIGIETSNPTAAAAASEAARTTQAVTTALKQAGLATADLKSSRLTVVPQWSYDDKTRRQKRDGFRASNTLLVDTAALDKLGVYIDAALGAGATSASDIEYAPADAAALRRAALAIAVREARADAAAVATAAGGSLGELLDLGTQPTGSGPVLRAMSMAVAAPAAPVSTTVVPGDIHVSASVTAQWRFKQ